MLEAYEAVNGWTWYVTDRNPDRDNPDDMFGLVCGFEEEWGRFSPSSIKEEVGNMFWKVKPQDISAMKKVEMVTEDDVKEHDQEQKAFAVFHDLSQMNCVPVKKDKYVEELLKRKVFANSTDVEKWLEGQDGFFYEMNGGILRS